MADTVNRIDSEIQQALADHEGDIRAILEDNTRMDLFTALSDMRELLLEWVDFDPEADLLQIGADYGAMTGLYLRKVRNVTVIDTDENALATVRLRYAGAENLTLICAGPAEFLQSTDSRFDVITMMGAGAIFDEESVKAAVSLLTPAGQLILAAPNPLGVKYWAGTQSDEPGFSKHRIETLLNDAGSGHTRFFYPMPDYRYPTTIYSDEYLPKKGDLTRVTEVYDYPSFHVIDQGEKFDKVCEEGTFDICANSYLVFYSRDISRLFPEKDRVYVKYNKTRRDIFQIRTSMVDQAGKERVVEKAALCPEAEEHIASFEEKYEKMASQQRSIGLLEPMPEAGSSVCFRFLKGRTRAEKISSLLLQGETEANEEIRRTLDQIFDVNEGFRSPFDVSDEFVSVFGEGLEDEEILTLKSDTSLAVSDIDALFENIIDTDDGVLFLDYEWVFDFPVPEHYVAYRILYYLYEQAASLMKGVTLGAFLGNFGIDPALIPLYQKMEQNFQTYVHGGNQKFYLENYLHGSKGIAAMKQDERDLYRAHERLNNMKTYTDAEIRKITEEKRLTDNHVTNLEAIIRDLRHEVDEQAKTLAYLDRHESLLFRLRRKAGDAFNARYPKGSPQRRRLHYQKEAVLHPIKNHRLYSTPEGQNLKKGSFEIGDIYEEYGRLKFDLPDDPMVSIVIPVYNEIAYTYACLASILAHTPDVSYEVIIADDVSTDATEHLSEFAEGLVICRNSTNQGFLKNCNNAASHARGKYLMFLNNDTQVTDGWLSSLLDLIGSDETIGMVGSKLVFPDGRLQEAGGIIWSDGSGWNYGRLDDPDKPEYNYVKDVDYISGAAILLPVSLWRQIGGFDERFAPAYCEYSDLAFEVRKAGYRVVYQPLSKIIHYEGISNGTDVQGSGMKHYQEINTETLRQKWSKELKLQCENNGNPDPFRARERSMGKPIILVIDHYVPTFDKDAGSRTTFEYIRMFIKKGFEVKFVGDNYMHEEPYSTILEQMGVEILYGPEYQSQIWNWLRKHGDDIAVAYLNRPHIATKYIDFILDNTTIKVIYYGHDLHFLRRMREYELTQDTEALDDAEYWESVELALMQKAAVSYYPSYVECDAIHEIDPDINVKDITAYVYEEFLTDIPKDFSKREGLLFVGGFAHPPNADAVLYFASEIYPLVREKFEERHLTPPDFIVVGSQVPDEIKALQQSGNGIVIKGFVSDEELARLYETCRVVVVPLRYGAGVKGKVVEALYYGAPIITTSVGAEGIPQAEEVMLTEDDPEEFAAALCDLYQDTDRCEAMCEKTQEYVRTYFSVDAAWSRIAQDFTVQRPVI